MKARARSTRVGSVAAIFSAAVLAFTLVPAGHAAKTGQGPVPGRAPLRAPSLFDNTKRMDVNDLDMVVTNHGSFAFNQIATSAGLVYPKGSGHTVLFAGGIWVGARVNGETRLAIGEYGQEFVPGPMVGGTFQTDQLRFKSYKIARGNTTDPDYQNWPVEDGAPTNPYGEPLLLGDTHIWSVCNDADPAVHRSDLGGTTPLGLEVQQSTFAFNRPGPLGKVIYLMFTLANKGGNTFDSTYATVWTDPDLGGVTDDLTGCDTASRLGFCYNAGNADAQYGSSPPAVGIELLQGPIVAPQFPGQYDTLGLASFVKYINGTDPASFEEAYNLMKGLHKNGTPIHEFENPANPVTTYMVTGDPVAGTGWLDTAPSDRRMMLSMGPFAMAPGETQVVIAAIVVGQGTDRLSSLTDLRSVAAAARAEFEAEFRAPLTIASPTLRTIDENQLLLFSVPVLNRTGFVPTVSATGLPPGATFTDFGNGSGAFQWLPGFDAAGSYLVTFVAHGADNFTTSSETRIVVRNINRKPTASTGGPYVASVDAPLGFNGGGSSDPDGETLTYAWILGDGGTATGPTPVHTYSQTGLYGVALTVSDGLLSDLSTTTVDIVGVLTARAFTSSAYRTIRLGAGKPQWCVHVEPVGWAFENAGIDPTTLVMKSSGTGSVDAIGAIQGKSALGGDTDGNGIGDVTMCFDKSDLRLLFSRLHGTSTVPVTIEGALLVGGAFHATLDVAVAAGGGGSLAASVSPNPLNPSATLSFSTVRPGHVRVTLFDLSGRLVRTLLDQTTMPAGYHDLMVDGRTASGERMASGVYFYRIESVDGQSTGRLVIAK